MIQVHTADGQLGMHLSDGSASTQRRCESTAQPVMPLCRRRRTGLSADRFVGAPKVARRSTSEFFPALSALAVVEPDVVLLSHAWGRSAVAPFRAHSASGGSAGP